MDILEEWVYNPIREGLFVELIPIDPHGCVARKVVNTTVEELVAGTEDCSESNLRREVWFPVRRIRGSSDEADVAPCVTSDEFEKRVNSGEKGVARTAEWH